MPAVKTGMTPPPMPGMPAPMQPMGGMPPAQNPFAPMPPMPLAGMPPPPVPPMPQGQPMPQTAQGQSMMGSTAGRRRRFGDALEGMLGRNQGIGAAAQGGGSFAPAQMVPRQQMVAPGTPMMRTPTPRPMADGGIVQYMQNAGEVLSNEELEDIFTQDTSWVDSDYGYNPSSPRAPNMREVMETISGRTVEDIYSTGEDYGDLVNQAVDFLYGSYGFANRFRPNQSSSSGDSGGGSGAVSSGGGSDQIAEISQGADQVSGQGSGQMVGDIGSSAGSN